MSIGTFLIVYRVYYQERRFFRSRRTGQMSPTGGSQTPNKAKSLFYLLFTLNLLYFILVSPVVLTTSILFRDEKAEMSYPRFKAIIYLMQYCNHSLNFIFYGNGQRGELRSEIALFFCRDHLAAVPSDSVRLDRIAHSAFASRMPTDDSTTVEKVRSTSGKTSARSVVGAGDDQPQHREQTETTSSQSGE